MDKNTVKVADMLKSILNDISTTTSKSHQKERLSYLGKTMRSLAMRGLMDLYLENNWNKNSDEEIELLKMILKACNTIYNYTGEETGLRDSEYDILHAVYYNLTDEYILTEPIAVSGKKVNHRYTSLRGTLDKIYKLTNDDILKNQSQKSIDDWVNSCIRKIESKTGKTISMFDLDVIVMPKFDGVSVVFEFSKDNKLQRALTRGDTKKNEATDITHLFTNYDYSGLLIQNPEMDYGHKTEVMMTDENFEIINSQVEEPFKNTRSVVSSILNSDEPSEFVKYLTIVPLRCSYIKNGEETLQFLSPGVYNYPYLECKLGDLEKIREFSFNNKWVNGELRCDGSVIHIKDKEIQKILGREDEKQKYEVAFKYTEEVGYSKVKDIDFTVGLFGRINPVVNFKPITLKGNQVSNASLGSYQRMKRLGLAKGDVIKVLYDIIPYADFDNDDPKCIRSKNDEILPPLICPECDSELEESEKGGILYCRNPKCPCRERGKILNYVKKMGIANISYATIEDFYREGILKSIKDLYSLKNKINTIISIEGYGPKKAKLIIDEIESHKEVIPSILYGSIGIEGLSIKKFQNIFKMISHEELFELALDGNEKFFTTIPGIKDKTAHKLCIGIEENEDLIIELLSILNVLEEPKAIVSDFKVIFTKVRNDELEEFIRDNYGEVQSSINRETDLVIVPNLSVSSSKITYAKKHDIPIVPIEDAKKYIKEKFL